MLATFRGRLGKVVLLFFQFNITFQSGVLVLLFFKIEKGLTHYKMERNGME